MKTSIIASLILLGSSLHAIESRLEMRHREAGGVGYSTGYTSLDYFLMTEGETVEVLLDLRGHVFNTGQAAGNIGLGLRWPIKEDKYAIGANVFYDVRQAHDLFCNQVGAGVEWLTKNIDFRVNGYLPVGEKQHFKRKKFEEFSGTYVKIRSHLKSTLPSVEGEIGTPLPRHFYFAIGSYYLFKQSAHGINVGNAWGGKIRAEVDLGRYFTIGLAATYDTIFKTRVQGIVSINIPFEKKKKPCTPPKRRTKCEPPPPVVKRNLRRVPIMRNEIIPIQDKRQSHGSLTNEDNEPIRFVFVNNTVAVSGDGSFEKPFASLKEAEKNSDVGDVIYVFAGDETPKNMDEGIVLKEDQILASSGAPLSIEDIVIPALTPGIVPHITNINPEQPIVANPGNSHLGDFFFIPPWEYIFGNTSQIDPFADARAEGFEVLFDPGHAAAAEGLHIIEDYQPIAPEPAAAAAPGWANVVEDYAP